MIMINLRFNSNKAFVKDDQTKIINKKTQQQILCQKTEK